jgi:hypothetical protein
MTMHIRVTNLIILLFSSCFTSSLDSLINVHGSDNFLIQSLNQEVHRIYSLNDTAFHWNFCSFGTFPLQLGKNYPMSDCREKRQLVGIGNVICIDKDIFYIGIHYTYYDVEVYKIATFKVTIDRSDLFWQQLPEYYFDRIH